MTDFLQLLRRLHEADVEFVVIGGVAAAAHGCTLVTQDLDVCVRPTPENWARLELALRALGPVHRMDARRLPFAGTADAFARLRNAYLSTAAGQIDCLGEVTGLGGFDAVRARALELEIDGKAVAVLDIPALIAAKQALGAPKDAEAVRQLEALARARRRPPRR